MRGATPLPGQHMRNLRCPRLGVASASKHTLQVLLRFYLLDGAIFHSPACSVTVSPSSPSGIRGVKRLLD